MYTPSGDPGQDAFAEAYLRTFDVLVAAVRRDHRVPTEAQFAGFHDLAVRAATTEATQKGFRLANVRALGDECWTVAARKHNAPQLRPLEASRR
jgi:hypothetical protein